MRRSLYEHYNTIDHIMEILEISDLVMRCRAFRTVASGLSTSCAIQDVRAWVPSLCAQQWMRASAAVFVTMPTGGVDQIAERALRRPESLTALECYLRAPRRLKS